MNNANADNFKCGFVAIVGRPNVGKSSIINAMIDEKLVAVSPKPQTTRNAVRCIYTKDNVQIIFVDTPGMHNPKHALGEFMINEIVESLNEVDAVCFVVEAGDRSVGKKEKMIIEALNAVPVPVILAINKVDTLKNPEFANETAEVFKKYLPIAASVSVSATESTNIGALARAISDYLPEQPPIYPEDVLMDATERFLAAEIIREKVFLLTDEEVPHNTAVIVEEYKTPDEYKSLKTCKISATVIVDRAGQKGIIIGKGGSMLKKIGAEARTELEKRTGYPVFLQLWVKVKPGWRKSEQELRRMGYRF